MLKSLGERTTFVHFPTRQVWRSVIEVCSCLPALVIPVAILILSVAGNEALADSSKNDKVVAVARLEAVGGSVDYLDDNPKKAIVEVDLRGSKFSDVELSYVTAFGDLRAISLRGSRITNDGLRHLSELKQLRFIELADTMVSSEGLAHLKDLSKLIFLDLILTKITKREAELALGPKVELRRLLVGPTIEDQKILKHVRTILDDASKWNRSDNRKCAENAKTLSLYCALKQACVDVTSNFNHRQPAMQLVRWHIQDLGKPYEHRLMDYNNDPKTSFKDLQRMFDLASKRIELFLESD
jgi:hypothetical protein